MDVKLLEELHAGGYEPILTRPEGYGITVKEYSERHGCPREVGRRMLEKAVEDGILTLHYMIAKGSNAKTSVYHRPGDWPPK